MEKHQEDRQLWITFLSCVTSVLSVLSAFPNYVIAVKLTKSSIQNVTLLTLRSCACADVLNSVIFLIFLSPSLFTGNVVYNTVTSSVGGFLSSWMCLTLNANLVFLIVQRYTLACRICCWRLLRDKSKICVATIWLTTGIMTSLPFAHSLAIYDSDQWPNHCEITKKLLRLTYEVIIFFVPGVLLAMAGIMLHKNNVVRCARSGTQAVSKLAVSGLRHSNKKTGAVEKRLSTRASRALGTRMTGIETTMSFIYMAFSSSLWNLIAFAFRAYGIWTNISSMSSVILSASHLLVFASGITRAIILLIVGRLAISSMKLQGMQQSQKRNTRTTTETTSEIDFKSNSSTKNAFTSFSLFMSPINGGLLLKTTRNRQSFWSGSDSASLLSNAETNTPSTDEPITGQISTQPKLADLIKCAGNTRCRHSVDEEETLDVQRLRSLDNGHRRSNVTVRKKTRSRPRSRSNTGVAVYSKCIVGSDSKPVFRRQPGGQKQSGILREINGYPTTEIINDQNTGGSKVTASKSLVNENNPLCEIANTSTPVEGLENLKFKIKNKSDNALTVEKDSFRESYLVRKRMRAKDRYFPGPPPIRVRPSTRAKYCLREEETKEKTICVL